MENQDLFHMVLLKPNPAHGPSLCLDLLKDFVKMHFLGASGRVSFYHIDTPTNTISITDGIGKGCLMKPTSRPLMSLRHFPMETYRF